MIKYKLEDRMTTIIETANVAANVALNGDFRRLESILKSIVSPVDILLSEGEDIDTWENYDDPDDCPLLDWDFQLRIAHSPEGTGRDVAFLIADSTKWWGLALRLVQDRLLYEDVLSTASRKSVFEVWTEFGFFGLFEGESPEDVLRSLPGGEEAAEEYQIELQD
jgi:hypothetical protein